MERTPVGIPASSSHSSRQSTGLSQTPNARPAELFGQRAVHYRCSRFGCQNGLPAGPGKRLLWNSATDLFAMMAALTGVLDSTKQHDHAPPLATAIMARSRESRVRNEQHLPHMDAAARLDLAGIHRTQRTRADAVLARDPGQRFATGNL